MKPDFIFIGPHKSGTTWIDNLLRSRGDVQLPTATKETFFFDRLYHNGWEWYAGLFETRTAAHKVCVEVAPSYLDKPEAIARIAEHLPDVKVIATLRNPIERGVAHYFHYLKGGEPDRGFKWMAENHNAIISNGLYYRNLNWWVDALGSDRVFLLDYHDLNRSPIGYVDKVCALLGLDMQVPSDDVLYARINEDGVPRFRYLAKLARHGSRRVRFADFHGIVNTIRHPSVRRFIFGPPPSPDTAGRLRAEAMHYYPEFFTDFERLDEEYGFDTSEWRRPEDLREEVVIESRRATPSVKYK